MPGNISMLYGGTAPEQSALEYAAWLGASLEARVEVRYARDPLSVLDEDQRAQYRNLLELGGWDHAHRFLMETFRRELAEDAKHAAGTFRDSAASRHLAWGKPLDLSGNAGEVLDSLAYRRDLLMAGFALNRGVRDVLQKRVLLGTGTPVMLIATPPAQARLEDSTMVVAWKPSPAARRALSHGLALLSRVRQVYLVAIEEPGERNLPTAQEMADHLLEAHSVRAEAVGLRATDGPADQLQGFYREIGADLLVMGAYSMPRLQEIFLGGFTRRFISREDCNVLLAH
ncbi:MAG: hypothetical protein RL434_145 [Pseudomonadota bacterium]